jgi:CRISPR/Cas system CMR-associated protein Cmr5 small subunit
MYGGNMTYKMLAIAFLTVSLGIFGCASERYTQHSRDYSMQPDTLRAMRMQDVIALSKAGVSDSLIIAMMDATDSWFQLKTQDVLDLRNAGVSEKVMHAMIQQPSVSSDQSSDSNGVRYYTYPPYFWYGGYYPFGYFPSFSVRLGYRSFQPGYFHHRRFR